MNTEKLQQIKTTTTSPMPAEVRLSPGEWLKKNLFYSWFSSILTITLLALAVLLIKNIAG